MARWKARGRLPISANGTFFEVVHQRILASKNEIPWAITWCCLRDPTFRFSQFDTLRPKGGTKRDFAFFSKIELLSKKVCDEVSLCANFQRQSCSYIIPLSNSP